MTINYQFGDVDAHGALIRAQAASLEAEHQAIVRDVLAAGDFWGGAGSVACQEFITQLGRNFQVIYEQANSRRFRLPATTWRKRTAPSVPAGPDRSGEVSVRGGAPLAGAPALPKMCTSMYGYPVPARGRAHFCA
ncbi:putative ESAT-6-like protein 6 [Mycobacterium marinum]|nr:putative ESAT-6-like protein 6 [Mycobacterium marinum]RFZ25404.1 putative ESAT-6-like protein 6 [Mycobacterium marinum]